MVEVPGNRNIDPRVKRLQQANHLTRHNANHSKRVRGSDKSLLATPTVARNKRSVRLLSYIAVMYHCFYQLVILSVAQLQALRPTIKYFYLLVLLVYPLSKLISQNNNNDSSEAV
jgi:hypothetical protein